MQLNDDEYLMAIAARPDVIELATDSSGERTGAYYPNNPENASNYLNDSTDKPTNQVISGMLKKPDGTYWMAPVTAMAYGLISAQQAALAAGQMVQLTDAQAQKFLRMREKELEGDYVQQNGAANGLTKQTASSALKSSMREGRQAAGGKYPFGMPMRTLKSGGLATR
jgi:hypothetical protein